MYTASSGAEDLPRRDRVDTNAHSRHLDAQCLGQGDDGTLARAVVARALALAGDVGGDGSNEDDGPAAAVELGRLLLRHLGGGQLGGVVCAEHVDIHAPSDRLGVALQEGLVRADPGGGHPFEVGVSR